MDEPKREWQSIQIRYMDGCFTEIRKEDLEKIDAVEDVINALKHARDLVANMKGLLGE